MGRKFGCAAYAVYDLVMNTTAPQMPPDRTRSTSWTSRYGSLRSLTYISEDANGNRVYLLEGYTRFTRGGGDPTTNWKMVDFEGGPYLTTGAVAGTEIYVPEYFTPHTVITGLDFITPDEAAHLFGRDPVLVRKDDGYAYLKITTTERTK